MSTAWSSNISDTCDLLLVYLVQMAVVGVQQFGLRPCASRAPRRRTSFRPYSMSSSTLSKTDVVKGRADDMKGKNVVVTGANSGIGLALSKALVSRGAHVTVAARDNAKGAE